MSLQIFKQVFPLEILLTFLDKLSCKVNNCYVITNDVYKKAVYNNMLTDFLDECKPYYHISKVKYIEKKQNYNSFNTIVRQICKVNNINFVSKIKYDKSSYSIIYYIYI